VLNLEVRLPSEAGEASGEILVAGFERKRLGRYDLNPKDVEEKSTKCCKLRE